MTRERALEKAIHLSKTTHSICVDSESFWENVIAALSAEPCEDCVSREEVLWLVGDYDLSMGQVVKGIHALPSVSPQPCGDCISRQAALAIAYDMSEIDGEHFTEPRMVVDIEDIQKLPSVSPRQKVEKWIPVN